MTNMQVASRKPSAAEPIAEDAVQKAQNSRADLKCCCCRYAAPCWRVCYCLRPTVLVVSISLRTQAAMGSAPPLSRPSREEGRRHLAESSSPLFLSAFFRGLIPSLEK